jgi:hypothetical protein
MNLFPYEPTRNLLPFDGIANYYGPILTSREAQDYLEALLTTIRWKKDEAVICGKHIVTTRRVAWYVDSSYSYTYSGTTKVALPWTSELRASKGWSKRKRDARSIRVSAICTVTAAKAWAGTATTKRPPERCSDRLSQPRHGKEIFLSTQTQDRRLSDLDPTRERQPPCHEGHNPDLLAA